MITVAAIKHYFCDYFIPRDCNEYKPRFFGARESLTTAILIVALFIAAASIQSIVISGSPQFAAVIVGTLVDLTNNDRARYNLGSLTTNSKLSAAAQMKANDMAARGYFSHDTPDGVAPWDWFQKGGYEFTQAGENLAVFFSDSMQVEEAWMNSPSHRANILNGHFTEIGIAVADGYYQGRPTTFVVQFFGKPANFTPIAQKTVVETKVEPPQHATLAPTVAAATKPAQPHVVVEDKTFIAVKKDTTQSVVPAQDAAPDAEKKAPGKEDVRTLNNTLITLESDNVSEDEVAPAAVSAAEHRILKLATSPKTLLRAIYLILASVIAVALAFLIGIELEKQHAPSIAFGVGLLVLIVFLSELLEYVPQWGVLSIA